MGHFLDTHKELLEIVWDMATDLADLDLRYNNRASIRTKQRIAVLKGKLTGLATDLKDNKTIHKLK